MREYTFTYKSSDGQEFPISVIGSNLLTAATRACRDNSPADVGDKILFTRSDGSEFHHEFQEYPTVSLWVCTKR